MDSLRDRDDGGGFVIVTCPACEPEVDVDLGAVGHTCPAIDKVARIVRRHVIASEDRRAALALLEELRSENLRLRDRATRSEERARLRDR